MLLVTSWSNGWNPRHQPGEFAASDPFVIMECWSAAIATEQELYDRSCAWRNCREVVAVRDRSGASDRRSSTRGCIAGSAQRNGTGGGRGIRPAACAARLTKMRWR